MDTIESIILLIPKNQDTYTNSGKKWINSRKLAEQRIGSLIKDKLQEYTEFLMKEGYCDTDVISELPTSIDRFLHEGLKNR